MALAAAGPLSVFLVIILGPIKTGGRHDLGDYRFVEFRLGFVSHPLGNPPLLLVKIENRRSIIVADVRALPVKLRRVVHPKKLLAERFVTHFIGIEFYQHGLGMSGGMRTDLLVGRVLDMAAGIAGCRLDHARYLVKIKLHAPEASRRKQSFFHESQPNLKERGDYDK